MRFLCFHFLIGCSFRSWQLAIGGCTTRCSEPEPVGRRPSRLAGHCAHCQLRRRCWSEPVAATRRSRSNAASRNRRNGKHQRRRTSGDFEPGAKVLSSLFPPTLSPSLDRLRTQHGRHSNRKLVRRREVKSKLTYAFVRHFNNPVLFYRRFVFVKHSYFLYIFEKYRLTTQNSSQCMFSRSISIQL